MLSRRKFLKLGGAGALIVTAGASAPLFMAQSFSSLGPGAKAAGGPRALVIVELEGGNDGLNTVIPFENDQYYKLRPNLAIGKDQVLKLPGATGVGLHPAMATLQKLYQQGYLAIVQGVGYPNPNYSHFEASDIWQSAQPQRKADRSGWLGRYLDTQNDGQCKAASLVGESPLALYSRTTLVPAINGLEDFKFQADDYYSEGDGSQRLQLARQIYQHVTQDGLSEYVRAGALDALSIADVLARQSKEFEERKSYNSDSDLARQLASVVQMLVAGLDFRVFYVRLSGFDTHSNQADQHAGLLKDLSESLTAFYADLTRLGLAQQVVTLTFSEFGRRPQENGGGTDHGSAQPLLILGGQVRGGLYGPTPSLTDLDEDNLKYQIDFRQVYATVLKRWLGVKPEPLLGGNWSLLPFMTD